MIVEKKGFNFFIISDIIKGYWVIRKYLYYNKRDAIKLFKKEFCL